MRRTITGEGKAAAPVMAKRHTAALKLSNKEKAEKRDEKRAKKARQASRLAHLALPQEMPIENELKLRKLATKGGECGQRLSESPSPSPMIARRRGVTLRRGIAAAAPALFRCAVLCDAVLPPLLSLAPAVVALFNAITKHQKALAAAQVQAAVSSESGPSSAAASGSAASGSAGGSAASGGGRSFLELLRQTAAQAAEGKAAAAKAAPVAVPAAGAGGPGRPGWSVLEDDYLETREEEDDAEGGAGGGFDEDGAVGGKAVSVKSKRAAAAAAAARAASATRGRTELPDILGDSSDSD
jgi:hypothetical protein